jgi:hypothetical protein
VNILVSPFPCTASIDIWTILRLKISAQVNVPQTASPKNDVDVIYGRGNHLKKHPGNIKYRSLVQALKEYYVIMNKKHIVSKLLYEAIRCQNPAGKFLSEQAVGKYVELDEAAAIRKISQCFRENQRSVKTGMSPIEINRTLTDEEVSQLVHEMIVSNMNNDLLFGSM